MHEPSTATEQETLDRLIGACRATIAVIRAKADRGDLDDIEQSLEVLERYVELAAQRKVPALPE